ncbi:DUF4293 domain-containing protein [Roseivirga sp. E12]|uniref:DUF4293 domain-containing protein n=1 Tax=Roseivirga sp. E12 TaxID=2819237 RepID=UPI001ABCD59B|nr:DUF4293 domain-containing protein [Roseivirga sp. E12]MBO3700383.1 DUF4293 domain-containing protein [Roseivirga sp. E12]
MIQRFQTVLLLLVALCMALILAYPIWFEQSPDASKGIIVTALKMEVVDFGGTPTDGADDIILESRGTWYIAALAIAASLVAFISIFQFKNRLNQMKLGALNALLMAATLGVSFYKVYQFEEMLNPAQGSFSIGFFLSAVAMVLNVLSNRFIRKDEKLIKSVDRIR